MAGLTICEDCYLEKSQHVRIWDPWAVYPAKQLHEVTELETEENLTGL